jgi:hypothetical protein
MKHFTLQEACLALAIDQVTLYRWLKRANIEPIRDSADERKRLLTLSQLKELAHLHSRQLQGKNIADALQLTEDITTRLEALEKQVSDLAGQVAALLEQKPAPPVHILRPARAEYTIGEGGFPEGLVSVWGFTALHHMPHSTIRKAIDTGRLEVVKGDWKQGKTRVKEGLDATGRRQFWQLWHENERFTPCEDCPHTHTEGSDPLGSARILYTWYMALPCAHSGHDRVCAPHRNTPLHRLSGSTRKSPIDEP